MLNWTWVAIILSFSVLEIDVCIYENVVFSFNNKKMVKWEVFMLWSSWGVTYVRSLNFETGQFMY